MQLATNWIFPAIEKRFDVIEISCLLGEFSDTFPSSVFAEALELSYLIWN